MDLKQIYHINFQRQGLKKIIKPVDKSLLKKELNPDRFVRLTNVGNNEIYIIDAHDSPHVMRELGRLREITFRVAGGGTGERMDIDDYDTAPAPFKQIVVWNPMDQDIVGSYRYIKGVDIKKNEEGYPLSPTSKLFEFSKEFISDYLPYCVELGRSFVQPKYQSLNNPRFGIYALDNIWDGLGTIIQDNPEIKYFYGKMTMYNAYNREARNLILYFLDRYFKGKDSLMKPVESADLEIDYPIVDALFSGLNYQEGFRVLNKKVRELNENIPPLIRIYMGLTSTMRCYGTSGNEEFGPVEETAILLNICDIYPEKLNRHVNSYISGKDLW